MSEKWTALDDALEYASSTSQQPKDGNDLARADLARLTAIADAAREVDWDTLLYFLNFTVSDRIDNALVESCEKLAAVLERGK
jgi:hypothetical protein